MFKGVQRIFNFFRHQSENFKILLIHGTLVGGGMRQGAIKALTQQYTNLYVVALGATKVQLGLIQSITTAGRIVLSGPIGQVIDRVSLKKMLLLGMIFGFLSPLMYALAVDWYMVIPAVLFLSVSMAATWTVRSIFLADSLRDTDRATGFSVLSTLGAMPGIFMPFISAYLVEAFGGINQEGIRPLFYIQFILLVPISLWVYKRLKDPKRDKLKKPLNFLQSLKKFIVLDKGPRIWLLVGIFDSFGMIAFPFLMVFAVEVKGATTSIIALMGVANTLAIMLLTIPFGRLADRIGRKLVMILGLAPMFAWVVTLVYGPSSSWLIVASVFEGAFLATFPIWQTFTMELIPKHLRGSYGGIQGIVRGLASMTASTLGGILWETVGPGSVFLGALAIETVAMMLIIALPETLIKNKEETSDKKEKRLKKSSI